MKTMATVLMTIAFMLFGGVHSYDAQARDAARTAAEGDEDASARLPRALPPEDLSAMTLHRAVALVSESAGVTPRSTKLSREVAQRLMSEPTPTQRDYVPAESGSWNVTLSAEPEIEKAVTAYETLRAGGYQAHLTAVIRDAKTIHVVRIAGMLTEDDAVAMALRLKLRLGFEAASISR